MDEQRLFGYILPAELTERYRDFFRQQANQESGGVRKTLPREIFCRMIEDEIKRREGGGK